MSRFGGPDPVAWASRSLAKCGIDSPRMEAQLLLALALGVSRTVVVAGLHEPLGSDTVREFEALVSARCRHVPLAYLRGYQEFYGLEFEVGPAVLIPRPETEMLVDFVLEKLDARQGYGEEDGGRAVIADVGTGSGCIAVACLVHCPETTAAAIDLAPKALATARRNAVRHGVSGRLRFIECDLLTCAAAGRFDLIVSNPPYVPTAECELLQPEVRDAEPRLALDGGPEGLAPYRRLAPQAARALARGGWLAVEVGLGQAPAVARIFALSGLREIETRKDLAGIERLVAGKRSANLVAVQPRIER